MRDRYFLIYGKYESICFHSSPNAEGVLEKIRELEEKRKIDPGIWWCENQIFVGRRTTEEKLRKEKS